jgi:hypothetical protein
MIASSVPNKLTKHVEQPPNEEDQTRHPKSDAPAASTIIYDVWTTFQHRL